MAYICEMHARESLQNKRIRVARDNSQKELAFLSAWQTIHWCINDTVVRRHSLTDNNLFYNMTLISKNIIHMRNCLRPRAGKYPFMFASYAHSLSRELASMKVHLCENQGPVARSMVSVNQRLIP